MKSRGNQDERESARILDRISRETDGGSTLFDRAAGRARNHISAADVDQSDEIEVWGTRIGRVLSLIILAALTVFFILFLAQG